MDDDAVSAVMATILLAAITVILATAVFVLVDGTTDESRQTAPRLSLFSDSTTRPTDWVVKLGGVTHERPLSDYEFVHSTPDAGTIVYRPADDTPFVAGMGLDLLSGDLSGADDSSLTRVDSTTTKADAERGYRLRLQDVSDDGMLSVLDTLRLTYDGPDADGTYDERLPTGPHRLELWHSPTKTIAGSITKAF